MTCPNVAQEICSTNLSYAWGLAFLRVMDQKGAVTRPFVVTVTEVTPAGPAEDIKLRDLVSTELRKQGMVSIADNAFMVFPFSVWLRRGRPERQQFFQRCTQMLPKLQARSHKNQYGIYFGRMIAYSGSRSGEKIEINQLAHILRLWDNGKAKGHKPRESALQVAILDPAKDHTGQVQRGFPCLQQVGFSFEGSDGLAVTGFYPTQFVFDRGYGNYLGLCHLGAFMAHEMGLRLVRMSCFINAPRLGYVPKSGLLALSGNIRAILGTNETQGQPDSSEAPTAC